MGLLEKAAKGKTLAGVRARGGLLASIEKKKSPYRISL